MEFMDLRADMKAITNLPSRVQWVKTHEARRLVKVSALCLVWCFNTDGQEGYLSRKGKGGRLVGKLVNPHSLKMAPYRLREVMSTDLFVDFGAISIVCLFK